jgi:hypothetical protein
MPNPLPELTGHANDGSLIATRTDGARNNFLPAKGETVPGTVCLLAPSVWHRLSANPGCCSRKGLPNMVSKGSTATGARLANLRVQPGGGVAVPLLWVTKPEPV